MTITRQIPWLDEEQPKPTTKLIPTRFKTKGCNDKCRFEYPIRYKRFSITFNRTAETGYKYCGSCEFCVKTTDLNCRCCGIKFRLRPRNSTKETLVRM